ncbi:MAG: hypothetical protein K0R51_1228 [Cytophagaceae bacterium]|jgi:hypothetical protein|nr:hypothetical protein [Cytophagaceae bacterium]
MTNQWLKNYLLITVYCLVLCPCQAQQWSYSTLNESKSNILDVGSIGHKIFFYSGLATLGGVTVFTKELEIFDVRSGTKETITLTGDQIRRNMAIVTSGSKIFFAGGYYSGLGIPEVYFKRVDVYDTLSGQWTVEELSQARKSLAAAAANGIILFGGGYGTSEPNHVSKIVDFYDQHTQTWTNTVFPLSAPGVGNQKTDLTAASIGGKIFFAGGDYVGTLRDVINIYDSQQQQWLPNKLLAQKKTRLKSIVYHGKILFVGGTINGYSVPSDTIDIYDHATDSWSTIKIPYLFKKVQNTTRKPYRQVAQAGCKMFLLPAPDADTRDSVAVYDLARNTWSFIGLPDNIYSTSIAAAENKVYFAGGAYVESGQSTDIIDILTLQPKLQSTIENTPVTSYNFGTVLQGEEKAIAVDFSNEGDYELLFADLAARVSISGDVDQFNIDYSALQSNDTLSPAQILSLPLTFNPTSNGLKQVILTIYSNDPDQPAYTFTVEGTGTDVTAVQDAAFSNSLQVYPNPTTGLLHVASKTQEPLYVEILNTQGTRMKETQYISNNEAVDLSSLSEGLYFLKIANGTSSAVVKVVKK